MNDQSSLASDHPDPVTAKLLQVVEPDNVSRHGLCCAIRLWPKFAQMVDMLPSLGEVLMVTGNDGAIFGQRGIYPELNFTQNFRQASTGDGGFEAHFGAWHSGMVRCHTHENGSSYSIEFRDAGKQVLHKVCLLEGARLDHFVEWVEYHQAMFCPEPMEWLPPGRHSLVPQRAWLDYDEIEALPEQALRGLIQYFADHQVSFRASVSQHGATHAGNLMALSLGQQREWLFTSDDEAGLHVDPVRFEEHLLHYIPATSTAPARATVKAFLPDGQLGLTLSASTEMPEHEWRDLLQKAIHTL